MATIMITRRGTQSGPRHVVRYRLGGRAYPIVHAGSFRTLKDAKARRDLIAGEIAYGRNPGDVLAALMSAETRPIETFSVWGDRYLASRIDIDSNTSKNYGSALKVIGEAFGDRDPAKITASEIAEWIAKMAETRKPGTLGQYRIVFRLALDHAGVDPNPARDPRVKLPKNVRDEPNPPTLEHFLAILDACSSKFRLPLITIEQGALREGEAVSLTWGDVDAAGQRLRLRRSTTKRDKTRWISLPEWLMDAIEETCPLEDRTPERRVFQGVTEATLYQAMTRACRNAKLPHYHPHDLRDRRITIWHHSGVVAADLAHRAGHSKPSMSLDVYSAAMPVADATEKQLRPLIAAAVRSR
jgi:integrase